METIALQSFNFPDRFVRHARFLGELTPVVNDLDKQDATFFWDDGLADRNLVSFRSRNFNARLLRHQDFRVKLHEQDRTFDPNQSEETPAQKLFRADATFVVVPGLADVSGLSFRSFNFPDRFLRHRGFQLFVESVNGDVGRKDATFRIVRGFVPAPPPPK